MAKRSFWHWHQVKRFFHFFSALPFLRDFTSSISHSKFEIPKNSKFQRETNKRNKHVLMFNTFFIAYKMNCLRPLMRLDRWLKFGSSLPLVFWSTHYMRRRMTSTFEWHFFIISFSVREMKIIFQLLLIDNWIHSSEIDNIHVLQLHFPFVRKMTNIWRIQTVSLKERFSIHSFLSLFVFMEEKCWILCLLSQSISIKSRKCHSIIGHFSFFFCTVYIANSHISFTLLISVGKIVQKHWLKRRISVEKAN